MLIVSQKKLYMNLQIDESKEPIDEFGENFHLCIVFLSRNVRELIPFNISFTKFYNFQKNYI